MGQAIGLVEVTGAATALLVANSMAKAATVSVRRPSLIGDGLVTVFVIGSIADVVAAVEAGRDVATRSGHIAATTVIGRVYEDVAGAFDLAT